MLLECSCLMVKQYRTFCNFLEVWKSGLYSLLLIFLAIFFIPTDANAQEPHEQIVVAATLVNHDTVPLIQLPEVIIWGFQSERDLRRFQRLIYNVKKVYPYARLAGIKLQEYESQLAEAGSERERRKIMRKAEEEIKGQYSDELSELTFTQGKILIKLIDRQTSETSYALLQELRGNVVAFFYQGFARIWGYNLKTRYDPNGEDAAIEMIVRMIETGQL
ncbi:MAG: DUF4294 domain-containing protein [Bacteroidia bacterium]|nr:DUF4294 domain-containing protein [Bacteroidia bacterium]